MATQWFCYVHVGDDTPLMMPLDADDRTAALRLAHDLLIERPTATHAEVWDGDLTERIERAAAL
ncbi:hypothetical protein [Brevundimonas sp.]|jgi:hypothetical protein|uniref:hypothetical protein n=1 Tax=Brevundimonas sp. TaxID=1871086 RepID=UPI002E149BDA|nr:hypothetical protein [Brevundimonas sp.]